MAIAFYLIFHAINLIVNVNDITEKYAKTRFLNRRKNRFLSIISGNKKQFCLSKNSIRRNV